MTADRVKSEMPGAIIFLDGDGKEFYRIYVDPSTVEKAFGQANLKYSKKELSFASGDVKNLIPQVYDEKKLLAIAFVDDGKDSQAFLENLQDRWVAKYHEKLVFAKVPFDRGAESSKEWGVTAAPSLVLFNPQEGDDKKRVVDRLIGKKELVSIHGFLAKNLDRSDAKTAPRR
jgi:hypothetical protein